MLLHPQYKSQLSHKKDCDKKMKFMLLHCLIAIIYNVVRTFTLLCVQLCIKVCFVKLHYVYIIRFGLSK